MRHSAALARDAGGDALADAIADLADDTRTTGPYGRYPADGPLAGESVDGVRLVLDDDRRSSLGERLAAALEHAHAGWSTDGIVTLSQLVSFLAFQLRVAAGLRLLTTEEAA